MMKNKPQATETVGISHPAILFTSWFGVGLIPFAPGTWGSLAALPFAWFIVSWFGWPTLAAVSVIMFILGIWAADHAVRLNKDSDPQSVVVDEVVGQWLVLCAAPLELWQYGLGFLMFRLFDIAKPWPVSWAERRFRGGLGVMVDDVFAAGYGIAAMLIVNGLFGG